MEKILEGIYCALRHPAPLLLGETNKFLFRAAIALLLNGVACAALTQDDDRHQDHQSHRHNRYARASQYFGLRRFHSVVFHGDILHQNLVSYFFIEKATPDEPYLGLRLDLDPSLVASVLMEADIKIKKGEVSAKAMDVHSIDANLLDAVVRLVRLADEPGSCNVLAPLIVKEIIYRLLAGGQGARLGHLLPSGDTQRISRAIGHLREHFDEPLKIDDIARQLGMSVSGFHHHFKSVTAMSPLQFQKQIRLQEARRLMLGEDLDAASAGFRVGYEDPSYFSRDYKKLFGSPPQRDIVSLRNRLDA